MRSLRRQRSTPGAVVRRRGPWLRSVLERLDDLEASDLFGDPEPEPALTR